MINITIRIVLTLAITDKIKDYYYFPSCTISIWSMCEWVLSVPQIDFRARLTIQFPYINSKKHKRQYVGVRGDDCLYIHCNWVTCNSLVTLLRNFSLFPWLSMSWLSGFFSHSWKILYGLNSVLHKVVYKLLIFTIILSCCTHALT